jgi:hypothetical protein
VYYRRYASITFHGENNTDSFPVGIARCDASVGINGDLFRPVTTSEDFVSDPDSVPVQVDTGGEIGLLDNYQIAASPVNTGIGGGDLTTGPVFQVAEFDYDFYDWPTGGPIVDSFDTITCGFLAGNEAGADCEIELRYDFYWDVAEQGRSTNPFGRPSTR